MFCYRGRGPLVRHSRGPRAYIRWLVLLLLALCVVSPFLLWQYSSTAVLSMAGRGAPPPPMTLLEKLQHHKAAQATTLSDQASLGHSGAQSVPANKISGEVQGADAGTMWLQPERVTATAHYLQEAVLHPQRRTTVASKLYVIDPEPYGMRQQHRKVSAYLASTAFSDKQAARKAQGRRGIIINAGGPQLISSVMVTLKVLREVLNCSLPVELVWHSPSEMDPGTLSALQTRWGPLTGVDLSSLPWPAHHRPFSSLMPMPASTPMPASSSAVPPGHAGATSPAAAAGGSAGADVDTLPPERAAAKLVSFVRKVQSLTASRFASALLLDADNLPLSNPEELWSDASFQLTGNLFWPDFWSISSPDEIQDVVFDMVGLKAQEAAVLLSAGKGGLPHRGTESGQLLVDLVRHADVWEWALWINTFADSVYRAVWGDKDTYALAFAVAGKAHEFNQIQVPPAGAFSWQPEALLVKATQDKVAGWQLAGMVHLDVKGQPAFLHRTMNKFSWGEQPWPIQLLSAPLPDRWIQYFLALESLGPTVGVPITYAAPDAAFDSWSFRDVAPAVEAQQQQQSRGSSTRGHGAEADGTGSSKQEGCPTASFTTYWRLREHAVPVGTCPHLDATCSQALTTLLGSVAGLYNAAQLNTHPELLALSDTAYDRILLQGKNPEDASLRRAEVVPDAAPVLAWMVPQQLQEGLMLHTSTSRVIAASYAAFEWLEQHGQLFPMFGKATESNNLRSSPVGPY